MEIDTLQALATVLVAIAMAPALAHAFEFPGKKRLDRQAYVTVQGIYYPGFTLLGVSEPISLLVVIIAALMLPAATVAFWLTAAALIGLLGMQVAYWVFVHPTNSYWLRNASVGLSAVGGSFFELDPGGRAARKFGGTLDWMKVRNRWEYAHIARSALAFLSFVCLLLSVFARR